MNYIKMFPKQHLFLSLLFGLIIFFLFQGIDWIGPTFFIISSVLIDFDHYLLYVLKKKSFNLKKAFSWYVQAGKKFLSLPKKKRENIFIALCFFHGFEFVVILFVLGISFSKYFIFIALGISFHLLLDIMHGQTYMERIDKFSLIYDYFKYKRLKNIEEIN